MKIETIVGLIIAATILPSCAGHSGRLSAFPKDAVNCPAAYVFRASKFAGDAISAVVRLNGRDVAYLGPGKFVRMCCPLGDVIVAVASTNNMIFQESAFRCEPQGTYYFRVTLTFGAIGGFGIEPISEVEANKYLSDRQYMEEVR